MRGMKRFLAVLVGCAAFLPVGQGADGARRLDEIVPADTLLYASIPDVARAKDEIRKTALADIWREPEVRSFARDQLVPLLRGLFAGVARQKAAERGVPDAGFDAFVAGLDEPDPRIGVRPLDLPGILDGELSVAVLDASPREKMLTAVAVLGPCLLPDALRASLKEASAGAAGTGGTPYAKDGWVGAAAPGPQGRGEVGWACAPDRRLVATVGPPGTFTRVVDDLAKGRGSEAPLFGHPDYRAVAARRQGKGKPIAHAYLNVAALRERALASLDPADRAKTSAGIDALGLSTVRAGGTSLAVKDKGFHRMAILLAPGEKKGILSALAGDAREFRSLAYVPAGTHSFYGFRVDPLGLWETLQRAFWADALGRPLAGTVERGKALPALKEIAAALGTEVGLSLRQMGGMMPVPEATLFAELRDEPAVRKVVSDLLAREAAAGKLKTQTFPAAAGAPAVTAVMLPDVPVMPAFAFHKGWLVASLTPTAVKAACRRIDAPGSVQGIAGTGDFKAAVSQVGKPGSLLAYDEGPDSFRKQYNQMVGMLPMILMGLEQSGLELPPVDLAALPMADTVARHLFGSAQVMGADADGIYLESFGATPVSLVDAAGIGIAAALAIPNLVKAREKAISEAEESPE